MDVRPRGEQRLYQGEIIEERGVKRRPAARISCGEISPSRQQYFDDGWIPVIVGRVMERCASVDVSRIHIGTARQQRLHHRRIRVASRCEVQRILPGG